ncbi:MAG: hypothetical protein JRJ39_09665 [Deltaproteobacteria bacterium]|nr:hypothetical protein [Deltaproteobacteria bacterium]MBW2181438.1 hypothetical protein [Deltaproteobacteria bacterium]MBW2365343.1 hypothetical protein [Deltaproteobacteria bacterium]
MYVPGASSGLRLKAHAMIRFEGYVIVLSRTRGGPTWASISSRLAKAASNVRILVQNITVSLTIEI